MAEKVADTAESPPWIFHREIAFVPAKRQFTGFSNGGGGFRLETLNPTKSDPSKLGKRFDPEKSKELELDSKLSFGFSIMKIGAGLENLGNTCYVNSVLQCLTYTEPLAASLQSGRHKSSCRKAGFCALCAMQNHINRALQSTGKYLAPNDLVSNLRCISRSFQRQRMEDAHEYMVNLLESMHKCCLPSGVPSESLSAYEKSLVHQIFGGRLRSQVKCTQCSFCSDKFDPFLDLSLEINKADSLQKALANFTAEEYLDGGAREYQCQRCNKKVKALKQLSIYKAPNVLSIHLKRFRRHQPGQTQKIDKKVHFGPTLDLKSFVSGSYDGDLKYTLYGVLVHKGWNIHSGHYYCFIRTTSGIWHSLDDTTVTSVRENMVFDEKAYMLFYVRDRKNVIPKKPVDVYAKSMMINSMVNRMQSSSTKGPSSPVLTQVDVAVTGALKETLTKGKSIQGIAQEKSSLSSSIEKNMSHTSAIKPLCNGILIKDSIPLRDSDEKGSKMANSSSRVEEPSHVNIENGGPSKKRTNSDNTKKFELSGLDPTSIPISQRAPACKRLKKKFSKSQVTTTRLSSSIILRSALSARKKIKKTVKKSALKSNIPTQDHSGPSSFEPTTLHSPEKRSELNSSKRENISNVENGNGYNGNLAEGVISEKSRVRVARNGDTVATDRPQECSSSSHLPRNHSVGGEESRIDSKQNDLMNVLTRGLEETTVARWDEIVRPSSQIAGRSGEKPLTIGYIGDDWDEEYDKGKRKKVRTSITEFGGPNPFQEIATKKAKFKNAELKPFKTRGK